MKKFGRKVAKKKKKKCAKNTVKKRTPLFYIAHFLKKEEEKKKAKHLAFLFWQKFVKSFFLFGFILQSINFCTYEYDHFL